MKQAKFVHDRIPQEEVHAVLTCEGCFQQVIAYLSNSGCIWPVIHDAFIEQRGALHIVIECPRCHFTTNLDLAGTDY